VAGDDNVAVSRALHLNGTGCTPRRVLRQRDVCFVEVEVVGGVHLQALKNDNFGVDVNDAALRGVESQLTNVVDAGVANVVLQTSAAEQHYVGQANFGVAQHRHGGAQLETSRNAHVVGQCEATGRRKHAVAVELRVGNQADCEFAVRHQATVDAQQRVLQLIVVQLRQ
jgi:hypothetical protein